MKTIQPHRIIQESVQEAIEGETPQDLLHGIRATPVEQLAARFLWTTDDAGGSVKAAIGAIACMLDPTLAE